MKRKIITGLIAVVAIASVVMFVGCIEEKSPAPVATPTPTTTPTPRPTTELKHYSNPQYGFSFDYPIDWEIISKQEAEKAGALGVENLIVVLAKNGSNYRIRVGISVEKGVPVSFSEEDYQNYARMLDEASPRYMYNFQKVSHRIITVSGTKALEYVFIYDPRIGSGLDQIKQVSVVKNGKAYHISCGTPPTEFDKTNKETFELIIKSFNIE